jgi:hypothetical protein
MALEGDARYASRDELRRLGGGSLRAGQLEWRRRFGRGGGEGDRLRAGRLAAAVAGRGACRSLFVHAGLRADFLGEGEEEEDPVGALNARLRAALLATAGGSRDELLGGGGPLWTRDFADLPESVACPLVEGALWRVGARRMVVGHTVQREMATRCAGRLHLVDVGISAAYHGRAALWRCAEGRPAALGLGKTSPME